MNWSDWEMIWKRQSLPVGANADLDKLRQTFDDKHRKLARGLMIRDWAEAGAGLFVLIVLCLIASRGKMVVWPFMVSAALVLGVTLFFVRERLRARRIRLSPDAPVLRKIEADLAELRRQRWLLSNVAVWYLAPIFMAMSFMGLAARLSAQPWEPQRSLYFTWAMNIAVVFIFWCALEMSKKAVRKQIDPRIAELEELHSALTGNS